MKNPWMSAYLSAANRSSGPLKGQMAAEISRAQTQMMRTWTETATQMWMRTMFPFAHFDRRKR